MNEMLRVNIRENLQVVVQMATKYSDILSPVKLIEMFESLKASQVRLAFIMDTLSLTLPLRKDSGSLSH